MHLCAWDIKFQCLFSSLEFSCPKAIPFSLPLYFLAFKLQLTEDKALILWTRQRCLLGCDWLIHPKIKLRLVMTEEAQSKNEDFYSDVSKGL